MFINIARCLVLKKVNAYQLATFTTYNSLPDMPAPDMADKKLQNFL